MDTEKLSHLMIITFSEKYPEVDLEYVALFDDRQLTNEDALQIINSCGSRFYPGDNMIIFTKEQAINVLGMNV